LLTVGRAQFVIDTVNNPKIICGDESIAINPYYESIMPLMRNNMVIYKHFTDIWVLGYERFGIEAYLKAHARGEVCLQPRKGLSA
jgi:hypothetical protein